MKIKRALLSVFDKTNLKELATFLTEQQVELVSTGGTARFLREHDLPVTDVSSLTRFPEMMDGRVKTLHPGIHGGILARRDEASHMNALHEHHLAPIDLVVINLYPFETVAADPQATPAALIENIDIGGPSMLRSAAKNHDFVTVLCDPNDYDSFVQKFFDDDRTQKTMRQQLAVKAFAQTARYDQIISQTLSARIFDKEADTCAFSLPTLVSKESLRYGENPHQNAAVLIHQNDEIQLAAQTPLQGKALSYNNLLDADAALFALRCLIDGSAFQHSASVVIKHGTPCGAALDKNLLTALRKSLACDPTSAFGGIIALSHEVDLATADILSSLFLEVIIAPGFSAEARQCLARKKDLRLLALENILTGRLPQKAFRSISGGFLAQHHDQPFTSIAKSQVVTQRAPTAQEWLDLDFAFRLSIPCRSNAITIASENQLRAACGGQTSRVDAVQIAIQKANERGHALRNAALGSDAFFPFSDSIDFAAKAGITAIAQPGGSKRDLEVIAAADAHNIAMVFTGERHFRH